MANVIAELSKDLPSYPKGTLVRLMYSEDGDHIVQHYTVERKAKDEIRPYFRVHACDVTVHSVNGVPVRFGEKGIPREEPEVLVWE